MKRKKHKVFNSSLDSGYFSYPKLTSKEEQLIIADLFEQILLFDRIVLRTGKANFALFFLMKNLGLKTVEKLIESKYIQFLLFTPIITTSIGVQKEDGTIDQSSVIGKPPIISGTYQVDDDYADTNIMGALKYFDLRSKEKKNLKKKILKNYIVPDGMGYASNAAKFITDAYESNLLKNLGLPFDKTPEELHVPERRLLRNLGHSVLETSIVSEYSLKTFINEKIHTIYTENLKQIGKALDVTENANKLLELENIPNLKNLYLQENFKFEDIFNLRHLNSSKHFRNWINNVSTSEDAKDITTHYLDELKGKNGFLNSTKGKFTRSVSTPALGMALTAALGVPGVSVVLSLVNTFIFDNLLKNRKPSTFIENLKDEMNA